jgi:hypothetical protein
MARVVRGKTPSWALLSWLYPRLSVSFSENSIANFEICPLHSRPFITKPIPNKDREVGNNNFLGKKLNFIFLNFVNLLLLMGIPQTGMKAKLSTFTTLHYLTKGKQYHTTFARQ